MMNIGLVFLTFAYVVAGTPLSTVLETECDAILLPPDQALDGRETPSPIEVNSCYEKRKRLQKSCDFNTDGCRNRCRFGFIENKNGCSVNCTCASSGIFEGDIRFERADLPQLIEVYSERSDDKQNAAASNTRRWDNDRVGNRVRIAYVMDSSMSSKARTAISDAIAKYKQETCLDFVPRTSQNDYLVFKSSGGCWSYIGRRGGAQSISIGNGCEWPGIVQHELLHALGFWHEQSRPDRDSHVRINFANIVANMEHNFQKRSSSGINSFGSTYDKTSIMHYGGYAFSKNRQPTIVDIATNKPIRSQRNGLTESDKFQVNKMYRCSSGGGGVTTTTPQWGSWSAWSRCSRTCGVGAQARTRTCFKGSQATSTSACLGVASQRRNCELKDCSVNQWSAWGSWGACTRSCGGGYRWRSRRCNGNARCPGSSWESQKCNTDKCSPDSVMFGTSAISSQQRHCNGGELKTGDFNGDGKADLICIFGNGWTKTLLGDGRGRYESVHWQGWSSICGSTGGGHVGDFNGDGSDDYLCFKPWNKKIEVSFSRKGSFKTTFDWSGVITDFCKGSQEYVVVGDVNGDGKADLICKGENGNTSVLLNEYEQ